LLAALAACGTQPADQKTPGVPTSSGKTSTPPAISSHQPSAITGPAGTLDAVVKEPPELAESAIRYLRIEDATGKPVVEREFRAVPVELSEYLPAARYRLISWARACSGRCGDGPGAQPGKPDRICGIRFEVKENILTHVSVDAPADADCTMTMGS
jgi:hypothetical protein